MHTNSSLPAPRAPESIVYTPVNENITNDATLKLDLNYETVMGVPIAAGQAK